MAERRMFAKSIIDSDAFLDLPATTQNLYFHLCMRADDDGFVNNPKRILRTIGAGGDDLKLLITKSFVIPFESGVCVIKHWRIHNYIQKDRYKETQYINEKGRLQFKGNGAYSTVDTECIQDVSVLDTQVRLGKDRLVKDVLPGAETAPDRQAAAFIGILLNDGSSFAVYQSDVEHWRSLYPAVNIEQELRKIAGWSEANPRKRKTAQGIKRHINTWLAKEQDRGGTVSGALQRLEPRKRFIKTGVDDAGNPDGYFEDVPC